MQGKPTINAEHWRKPQADDKQESEKARSLLVSFGTYPTGSLEGEQHENGNANYRLMLHDIVDNLAPEDLRTLYDMARVLALHPDTEEWMNVSQRVSDRILEKHGYGHLAGV